MRQRCIWGIVFAVLFMGSPALAQDQATDAFRIRSIFETALKEGQCYTWLESMAEVAGPRLSGSPGAARAVSHTRDILDTLGLDSVWLQPCVVPRWVRGAKEQVQISSPSGHERTLRALALGNSVGTGPQGVEGEVLEVFSLDALREMPEEEVRGKIVFFNRPMDPGLVSTFQAYGRAVDQRGSGPILAAEKGALAAVVRSMTTGRDTFPHTGMTTYRPEGPNIPAVAISTVDADILSALMSTEPVVLSVRTSCMWMDSVTSYNVIGQINGREQPEEIILVGGHLDSWDVGHGAHDDGTGCVQSMDVLYLLRKTGYIPRRTIRCVLFMNEENGLLGAKAYADSSNARGEFHLAAIESDGGGFRPMGFAVGAGGTLQEAYLKMVQPWWGLLEPYGLMLTAGGGGADISQLRSQGGMLIGLRPDTQRYFDFHHTERDVVENVHPRELKLGAASMTALVTLLDLYATRAYE